MLVVVIEVKERVGETIGMTMMMNMIIMRGAAAAVAS